MYNETKNGLIDQEGTCDCRAAMSNCSTCRGVVGRVASSREPLAVLATRGATDIATLFKHKSVTVFEIEEDMSETGRVRVRFKEDQASETLRKVAASGFRRVYVAFRNARHNPQHELEMEKLLEEALPDVSYSLSCRSITQKQLSDTVFERYITPLLLGVSDAARQAPNK